MIKKLRDDGGRAYAVAVVGMISIALIILTYLLIVIYIVESPSPDFFTWLAIPLSSIGAVAGAMQIPSTAERWRGNYNTPDPPRTGMEQKTLSPEDK